MKRFLIIILLAVAFCCGVKAQVVNDVAEKQDSISVSLITYYPGSQIYELYGHSAIRVTLPDGSGVVFNYGIFDFNAPNFVYRFIKGETDYMVKGYSDRFLLYGYEGRKVVEQELNLSQEQALAAYQYLMINALPQNATYRYNYVLDNCSTRPRDIIERAAGGTLEYPAMQDTTTFRKMMHQYNSNYAWSQFGIDIALGEGLDRTLTYREQMFVPMVLMNAFSGATIERNGEIVPLVKSTKVLNGGAEEGDIMPPTKWWATPMAVFVLLLLITIAFTLRDVKRGTVTRWYDSVLYGAMMLYGLLLFFLIFVSTHEATSPNWNGVWLNPFYIIPAILIWIKSAKKLLYWYHFANFAVLIVMLAMWYWIPQVANAAFYPLLLCSLVRSANYLVIYKKK